jgi:hypothetical protein
VDLVGIIHVIILISFLKAYVEELGKELLMLEEDKKAYVSQLVGELHNTASELDAGNVILVIHP